MVKFDVDGNAIGNSGRYRQTNAPPVDASAMATWYGTGKDVGGNYVFVKGDGFGCSAEEVSTTTIPTPGTACGFGFIVPSGFAYITGVWTSHQCNGNPKQESCALTYVAKTSDDDFIAGHLD